MTRSEMIDKAWLMATSVEGREGQSLLFRALAAAVRVLMYGCEPGYAQTILGHLVPLAAANDGLAELIPELRRHLNEEEVKANSPDLVCGHCGGLGCAVCGDHLRASVG